MEPVKRLWMFHNWMEDRNEKFELAKDHAYLVGSFINPERVKKLLEEPANTVASDDKSFEESMRMVREEAPATGKLRKRKRPKV